MGVLISLIFWGTFYGTSYMKDTKFGIDTLNRNYRELKTDVKQSAADNKAEFKKLHDTQQDQGEQIKYLLEHCPPRVYRTVQWRTVMRDPDTKQEYFKK